MRDLDPQLKRAIAQTVFFETTYEPKQVYVQSQVVVTRRLYYVNGAQLYGDMPNLPDVPGAMVKSLGDADHTTTVRDGRQYGMIEQRFAVFPERSGELTIPPSTVTGSVRLVADFGMAGRRIGMDVTSDALSIAGATDSARTIRAMHPGCRRRMSSCWRIGQGNQNAASQRVRQASGR